MVSDLTSMNISVFSIQVEAAEGDRVCYLLGGVTFPPAITVQRVKLRERITGHKQQNMRNINDTYSAFYQTSLPVSAGAQQEDKPVFPPHLSAMFQPLCAA